MPELDDVLYTTTAILPSRSISRTLSERLTEVVSALEFTNPGQSATAQTAGLNAWIDYCLGGEPGDRNAPASGLNKAMYLPAGNWQINDVLDLSTAYGITLLGDGKLTTQITQGTAEKAIFYCDGIAYGTLGNMTLVGGAANSTQGLLHIDWTGDYPATLKPQQLTFPDLHVSGGGVADVGIWIAKSGGGAQSDTFEFINPMITQCLEAGVQIGDPAAYAYNALSIRFQGGNIQSCTKDGIRCYGGSVYVHGTSFQPQTDSTQRQQRTSGYDINCISCPAVSTVRDVRSEGSRLAFGNVHVFDSECSGADAVEWNASTAVTANRIYQPLRTGQGGITTDGKVYLCITAGTTGASEPTWSGGGKDFTELAAPVAGTSGSGTVTSSGQFAATDNLVGKGIWIVGAGAAGADYIGEITARANTNSITVSPVLGTTVAAAAWRHAPIITDGTAEWMHWEFDAVFVPVLQGCKIQFGRTPVQIGTQLIRNTFSRPDYINTAYLGGGGVGDFEIGFIDAINTVRLGDVFNGNFINHGISTSADGSWFTEAAHRLSMPVLIEGGSSGTTYPSVGILRGDGSAWGNFAEGSETDLSRNILAILGTLGRRTQFGTNVAGKDLNISGGLGSGNGGGGKVNIRTQSAGSSGTSIANSVVVAQFDTNATAGNTRFLIYDVDNGTLERVSVGAADSGGSGFKVLRIPN